MLNHVQIEELSSIEGSIKDLSELLIQIVEGGASIGFLPPLQISEAMNYWEKVLDPDVILLVAIKNNKIIGTVQLHLCSKQNGQHRAEIAKLMTHPDYQRQGIAKLLMKAAEERAKQEGRPLMVLDTREGDPSNELYQSLGYIQAGQIPHYAMSANGAFDATVFYYKML